MTREELENKTVKELKALAHENKIEIKREKKQEIINKILGKEGDDSPSEFKFYSSEEIDKTEAHYRLIIGERSNGKSYSILKKIVKGWVDSNYTKQGALLRRWQDDFKGRRGKQMFDSLVANNVITELTNGEWTDVEYYSGQFYLSRFNEEKKITEKQKDPFCFAFGLTGYGHDKSTSYPNVNIIFYDEFIAPSSSTYLPDEFIVLMNTISTIIRLRDDVVIYMAANTVNRFCPIFQDMGLSHVKDQKPGTIDVYEYGDSGLRVAVEYCSTLNKKGKPSDKYFAFDNPSLSMITTGSWELSLYPHLCDFEKYTNNDVIYNFFIVFSGDIFQADVILKDSKMPFIYIHEKTTPIKNEDEDLVFTTEYSNKCNYRRGLFNTRTRIEQKIVNLFNTGFVCYQDNSVGDSIHNFINWSKQN